MFPPVAQKEENIPGENVIDVIEKRHHGNFRQTLHLNGQVISFLISMGIYLWIR